MSDLIKRLQAEAHDFNFFRAVQLLEEYYRKKYGIANPVDSGKIKFKPDDSIAFPANDITAIVEKDTAVELTLSFMGLVGVTSPLPVYFSEFVSSHPDKASALYDFLAIFNHRMYGLFYQAWKKYHFLFNFKTDGSDPFTSKIAMLCGMQSGAEGKKMRLLAYCGILSSFTRSARALTTLLSDYLDGTPVAIHEFTPRRAQLRNVKPLGASMLGEASILGTAHHDRTGKFQVIIGPLSRTVYEQFLPEGSAIADMKEIINAFLADPLEYDIVVQLQSTELIPVVLGTTETRLGETSSLGNSQRKSDVQSITIN